MDAQRQYLLQLPGGACHGCVCLCTHTAYPSPLAKLVFSEPCAAFSHTVIRELTEVSTLLCCAVQMCLLSHLEALCVPALFAET